MADITKAAEAAAEAMEKAAESTTEGTADPSDVSQFEELMSGNQGQNKAAEAGAEGYTKTIGDKILEGMQGLRDNIEGKTRVVESSITPEADMNMQDLFRTQMAITNLMITEDYVGKIVSKSTQTFDTILKNQ